MRWRYWVPGQEAQEARDEVFWRMEEDGLLHAAMSAHAAPTLALWRELTRPDRGWLLRCDALDEDLLAQGGGAYGGNSSGTLLAASAQGGSGGSSGTLLAASLQNGSGGSSGTLLAASAQGGSGNSSGTLLAAALLTPWRGRLWEFDFMVRRAHFALGPEFSRGALHWIWQHAPCDGLFGITPATHRHTHKHIEAGGFTLLGRLPGACYLARRGRCVDGVLVSAKRGPGPIQTGADLSRRGHKPFP